MKQAEKRKKQPHEIYKEHSYNDFKVEFDINIEEASSQNIFRLKKDLGDLSSIEQKLYDFFIENLTAKHKTHDFSQIKEEGALLAPRERERLGISVTSRNTSRRLGDNNIFFTIGVGSHDTPFFLESQKGHTIELKLHTFFEKEPSVMGSFFISGHSKDFHYETISEPTYLGDTLFHFTHDNTHKTKAYSYAFKDNPPSIHTAHMRDEIFCGKACLQGIALQFIQHIRRIGGSYQTYVFDTIENASFERKLEVLNTSMKYLMPGWIYPEGKLPGKLLLKENAPFITIHEPPKDINTDCSYRFFAKKEDQQYALSALKEMNFEVVDTLIKEKKLNKYDLSDLLEKIFHWNYSVSDENEDLNRFSRMKDTIIFFSRNNIFLNEEFLEVLLECRDLNMFSFLLSLSHPHPTDPLIRQRLNIHAVTKALHSDSNSTCAKLIGKDTHILRLLIEAGMEVEKNSLSLLYYASKKSSFYNKEEDLLQKKASVTAVKMLVENKANVHKKISYGLSPLIQFVEQGNIEGIDLLLTYNVPVNYVFRGYSDPNLIPISGSFPERFSEENGYTALHFLMIADCNIYEGKEGEALRLALTKKLIDKGADFTLRACNGDTAYSLALKNEHYTICDFLRSKNVDTVITQSKAEKSHYFRYSVAVIVRGIDKRGQDSFIMGKKVGSKGILKNEYLFPGGFQDTEDEDVFHAALRELQEETSVSLFDAYKKGTITCSLYHEQEHFEKEYRKHVGEQQIHYKTSYIFINIGNMLGSLKIYARDDLYHAKAIPLRKITCDRTQSERSYSVKHASGSIPVLLSNGILIDTLINKILLSEEDHITLHKLTMIGFVGDRLLVDALKTQDEQQVAYLLKHNVSPKSVGLAAALGNISIVKSLLTYGGSINVLEEIPNQSFDLLEKARGALSAAILGGNNEVFTIIFDATKKLDETKNCYSYSIDCILKSALEVAAHLGKVEMARTLLDSKLVTANDKYREFPLKHAAASGHADMIDLLSNYGADITQTSKIEKNNVFPSPIIVAIENGHLDALKSLLKMKNVHTHCRTLESTRGFSKIITDPLTACVYYKQPLMAKELILSSQVPYALNGVFTRNGKVIDNFTQSKTWLPELAALATQKVYDKITAVTHTTSFFINIAPDDKGTPSLHAYFNQKEGALLLLDAVESTLGFDNEKNAHYIWLSPVRLNKLFDNGAELHTIITDNEKERLISKYNVGGNTGIYNRNMAF